jgi:hypothetical protein
MPNTSTMNFQAYLEDAYRIIKEEPVILILGGFIVQLLTILSMTILAGPIMGGYFLLIIYYLRDNRKPSFNDIFSGLQHLGRLLPFFLVLVLILVGFMVLILPGFLFATWWLYVLPLMVDRKISYSEAMRLSMNKVNETGFFMHFAFLLLITVIPMMLLNFLSTVLPFLFVLKILLPPLQAGCLASLYIDQFSEPEPAPASKVGTDAAPDLTEDLQTEPDLAKVSEPHVKESTKEVMESDKDTPAEDQI